MAHANAYLNSATEASIQKAICQYLDAKRIVYSVTDSGLFFVNDKARRKVKTSGWGDITAILPGGRFWAIEVKSHSGKLRPAQIAMRDLIEKAGGVYTVARSVNDIELALRRI